MTTNSEEGDIDRDGHKDKHIQIERERGES